MKKVILFIVVCLLLSFGGCSTLFFDSYYSEKDFQGNQSMVQNYSELRRLVFNMMNNHLESAQLRFVGYSGNAVSDIASVCNAVKTESAYGAYCVDYVSYDLTQIVSYYEASIAISYKYTQEETALLQTTNNHSSFSDLLVEELKSGTERMLVKINNGSSDYNVVNDLVKQTIRENPLAMSYYPQFSVKIYSGNSSQKIYELNFQYDAEMNHSKRSEKLYTAMTQLVQNMAGKGNADSVAEAASVLSDHCVYNELAGNTAYDAFVLKEANGEGISSAFKAMCDSFDVECLIVKGKLERADHFWNIVRIDDAYYHIDVSALKKSENEMLFKRDEEQQVNYWWNQSAYPDCAGEPIVLQ